MVIDRDSQYSAFIYLEKDSTAVVEIELFADKAPITLNNFVYLDEEGFYDGLTFHRVIKGLVAQSAIPPAPGQAVRDMCLRTSSTPISGTTAQASYPWLTQVIRQAAQTGANSS